MYIVSGEQIRESQPNLNLHGKSINTEDGYAIIISRSTAYEKNYDT